MRDSVIPLDRLVMRSTIIVGFRISMPPGESGALSVNGTLKLDGKQVAASRVHLLDGPAGNLAFVVEGTGERLRSGVPYGISEGTYTVELDLLDTGGSVLATKRKDIEREEISRTFMDPPGNYREYRFVEVSAPTGTKANELGVQNSS